MCVRSRGVYMRLCVQCVIEQVRVRHCVRGRVLGALVGSGENARSHLVKAAKRDQDRARSLMLQPKPTTRLRATHSHCNHVFVVHFVRSLRRKRWFGAVESCVCVCVCVFLRWGLGTSGSSPVDVLGMVTGVT